MAHLQLDFFSEALGKAAQAHIIMPQRSTRGQIGVDGSNRVGTDQQERETYKCLYLLHGLSDDSSIWMRRTSIERYAAKYNIAVVMPDGETSFYCNMKYGGKFYDLITRELPSIVENMFPVSSRPEDRYIAGLSMGGYGALKVALREQGRYAACTALSPAGDIASLVREKFASDTTRAIFGDDGLVPPEDDILQLIPKCTQKPRIFFAIGTEDFLYKNNIPVRKALVEGGFDYRYLEEPGNHSWDFWDRNIQKGLEFMLEGK